MDCLYPTELDAYADGELSPERRPIVESHLTDCPACAAELRELNGLRALFAATPPALPAGDVMARFHERADSFFDWGTLRIARIVSGLAASVMIAGSLWLAEPHHPTTARPAQWEGAALLLPADMNEPPAGGFAPAEWALSDWSGRVGLEDEGR